MIFLEDAQVRQKVGGATRFRIVNVERHEHPKGLELTAERAADVVAYLYNTDEAISAVVTLGSKGVKNMVATTGTPPSASPEEIAEATELAVANPTVRASLGPAAADTKSLIVTHLFVTGVRARPSCATHRCLLLFFNTSERALDVTAIVDLSAGAVEVP